MQEINTVLPTDNQNTSAEKSSAQSVTTKVKTNRGKTAIAFVCEFLGKSTDSQMTELIRITDQSTKCEKAASGYQSGCGFFYLQEINVLMTA